MKSKALARLDSFYPTGKAQPFHTAKNNRAGRSQSSAPRSTSNRKYEGASHGHRTGSFPLNNLSPNKDIGMSAEVLRQRSKYLYQNTPLAKRAINALSNGIVGTGIIPRFITTNGKAEQNLKDIWALFAETTTCDFNGRLTFSGLENLIAKTYKRDGEVLILRRRVPVHESITGIQYQVLEMEYLATYINYQILPGGGYTYNGIEYDHRGKVMAYWLFHRHPSEWGTMPTRHPAEDVIHVLRVDYPGQNRGVPAAAPTIITERDLNEYQDAELMGKKVQASFAVARTTNDPDKMPNEPNPEDYDQNADLEKIEPGSIYHLYPGEQIQTITPPTASGTEDYRKSQHRNIATGYEVTYEMMTGDFSQVNFSSGRMGWIEHQRTLDHDQEITMIPVFCTRAMNWFLEQVPLTPGCPFVTLPKDLKIAWTPPRREMLDPGKETSALKNQLRTGLKSWSEVIEAQGDNPDEVIQQIAKDIALFKKYGIKSEWTLDLDPADIVDTPAKIKGEAARSHNSLSFGEGSGRGLRDLMEAIQDLTDKLDEKS